ncbi:immunoglobulin domain-containing protein, partial [Enterococcus faecium]|uniref:immunoglobulin domain-containing protein n=1 Tax=Enterococcus faecium TaxID=1352 RepID=UPI0034E93D11
WKDGNNSIISNSSTATQITVGVGTYKLTVTKDGCTGTATEKVVTAAGLSTPTISIQSGSTTFCTGGSVQLQASTSGNAAETFQWYRNGSAMSGQT